jgi:hypothetical protein
MKLDRSSSRGRIASAIFTALLLAHCSSTSGTGGTGGGDQPGEDGGTVTKKDSGVTPPVKKDGGTTSDDSGTVGDDDDDAAPPPPGDDDDAGPAQGCGAWQTGTLTGYNNSNLADDPNAGSVMEFTGLTDPFYDNVNIASIDMSDWPSDQYHWVDINYNGKVGRVGVWDACLNADCPDGTSCCSDNKKQYANPGYLLDVETRTAKRLWGIAAGEDTLDDKIQYRICDSFDPDAIAAQYGAKRD